MSRRIVCERAEPARRRQAAGGRRQAAGRWARSTRGARQAQHTTSSALPRAPSRVQPNPACAPGKGRAAHLSRQRSPGPRRRWAARAPSGPPPCRAARPRPAQVWVGEERPKAMRWVRIEIPLGAAQRARGLHGRDASGVECVKAGVSLATRTAAAGTSACFLTPGTGRGCRQLLLSGREAAGAAGDASHCAALALDGRVLPARRQSHPSSRRWLLSAPRALPQCAGPPGSCAPGRVPAPPGVKPAWEGERCGGFLSAPPQALPRGALWSCPASRSHHHSVAGPRGATDWLAASARLEPVASAAPALTREPVMSRPSS